MRRTSIARARIAACHFFVLRPGEGFGLIPGEESLIPCGLWIHVDVGGHGFSLELLAIATLSMKVNGDLILRCSDLSLVLLNLGVVNGVLLLVRTDLQLLQHEVLRDLRRLSLESRSLCGLRRA